MRSRIFRAAAVFTMAAGLAAVATAQSDVTPPQFKSLNMPASVEISGSDNPLVATFKATDDLSGVYMGSARAVGPHGQQVFFDFWETQPGTQISSVMSAFRNKFLEPGEYTVTSANLSDVAGNVRYYQDDELSALGRTTFTVKNKGGYDLVEPALQAGKVLTPVLSLSANHPGTHQAPFAEVTIDVLDLGNTAVAGTIYASASFCQSGQSMCLAVDNFEANPRRKAASTIRLGQQISRSLVPGVYKLRYMTLTDDAHNEARLTSSEVGGETDFSQYFDTTTITLTP